MAQLGLSNSTHTGKHKVLPAGSYRADLTTSAATDRILCLVERVKNVASALKYIKTGPHGQLTSCLDSPVPNPCSAQQCFHASCMMQTRSACMPSTVRSGCLCCKRATGTHSTVVRGLIYMLQCC